MNIRGSGKFLHRKKTTPILMEASKPYCILKLYKLETQIGTAHDQKGFSPNHLYIRTVYLRVCYYAVITR